MVDRRRHGSSGISEEIGASARVERLEAEVVKDEQIGAAEGLHDARVTTVSTCERQICPKFRPAVIDDVTIVAARFLTDRTGEPTLSHARWPHQGKIVEGVRSRPRAAKKALLSQRNKPFTKSRMSSRASGAKSRNDWTMGRASRQLRPDTDGLIQTA